MRDGQATLELTVALILIVILLMAGVKVFLWLNEGLVLRQVSYENTRIEAGSTNQTEPVLTSNVWVSPTIDAYGVETAPGYWNETYVAMDSNATIVRLDNATYEDLVISDRFGKNEVGFDEPFNEAFNIFSTSD